MNEGHTMWMGSLSVWQPALSTSLCASIHTFKHFYTGILKMKRNEVIIFHTQKQEILTLIP
jgi:uncharacterized protein (DUF2062 family)